MASMGLDVDIRLWDEVALAVEEAITGTGKLEVEVGNREEEDVEELFVTFVAVV